MNFIVAASTDIGNVKDTNQDSFSVRIFSTPLGKMTFAVLCDGMGGLAKGELASASVVNAFNKWSIEKLPQMCETGITDAAIREDWISLATEFNDKIKKYGAQRGISVGTTLTALLLTQQRYYIIHVGDTRVYEITDSLNVLTKDQTVVAREVEMGLLSEEDAKTDERRSVLLQCVGASDAVYPDMYFGSTAQNAVYMLCSDGFRHEISPQEIFEYLGPEVMVNESGMKTNMDYLINLNKQRMERDNITVLAIRTF